MKSLKIYKKIRFFAAIAADVLICAALLGVVLIVWGEVADRYGPARSAKPAAVEKVEPDRPAGHWLNESSGVRHNGRCRYFGTGNGRDCGPDEGRPCGICGG